MQHQVKELQISANGQQQWCRQWPMQTWTLSGLRSRCTHRSGWRPGTLEIHRTVPRGSPHHSYTPRLRKSHWPGRCPHTDILKDKGTSVDFRDPSSCAEMAQSPERSQFVCLFVCLFASWTHMNGACLFVQFFVCLHVCRGARFHGYTCMCYILKCIGGHAIWQVPPLILCSFPMLVVWRKQTKFYWVFCVLSVFRLFCFLSCTAAWRCLFLCIVCFVCLVCLFVFSLSVLQCAGWGGIGGGIGGSIGVYGFVILFWLVVCSKFQLIVLFGVKLYHIIIWFINKIYNCKFCLWNVYSMHKCLVRSFLLLHTSMSCLINAHELLNLAVRSYQQQRDWIDQWQNEVLDTYMQAAM